MTSVRSGSLCAGCSGTSVPRRTTRVARAPRRRSLVLDARRVGQHEPRGAEGAAHGALAGRIVRRGEVDVAAVDRDHQRRALARAQHRVGRRDRVVGVHQVVGELPAQPAQGGRQRRRRPGPPRPVAARARRGEEGHVAHVEAVELGAPRLGGQGAHGARRVAQARGPRGNGPVQHEHAHVGAGVARRQRLAVGPDAEHRVVCARIELADDRHLHRWTASVRTSSRRTYGRSARKARACASAASRA